MSESEETPQQRQLRIRQAKREAKLKASGQERLDKITKLSGRTPESMRTESPTAASQTPTPGATPTPAARPTPGPLIPETTDPEQQRLQEQYIRALLGAQDGPGQTAPGQGAGDGDGQSGQAEQQEAMMKMMESLLGGMSGDPNAPGAQDFPISANDISKMTGLPSFLTNMFIPGKAQAPPTSAELKSAKIWSAVQLLFAVVLGVYTILTLHRSISLFGNNPPGPATAQNPFTLFVTGELLLRGTRLSLTNQPGLTRPTVWWRLLKDIGRDGAILIFGLGMYTWWESLD